MHYSKKLNLKIDNDSINYLSQKLGNDKLLTLQEIKKLSIYGRGENVTYNDVLTSVGDSSLITINRICDNLFNTNKAPYFYDKIIEAGYNNILVIRSILNHFHFLLDFKESSLNDVSRVKNIIHFSRQKFINKQLAVLNIKKINFIISEVFKLEKNCKQEYSIANLLIKKFLINYSV
jgi:DNA polymerase III delta subunit